MSLPFISKRKSLGCSNSCKKQATHYQHLKKKKEEEEYSIKSIRCAVNCIFEIKAQTETQLPLFKKAAWPEQANCLTVGVESSQMLLLT